MASVIPSDSACLLCEYIHAGNLEGVRKCLRDVNAGSPLCTCTKMMHFAFDNNFMMALMRRDSHILHRLFDDGKDINQMGRLNREPLIDMAIREDDEEMVKVLIHFGANLNTEITVGGHTPLGLALTNAQPRGNAIAKILVRSGAFPIKRMIIPLFKWTSYAPLHIACFYGNFEFVKFLVEETFVQNDKFLGDYLEEISSEISIPSSYWNQPHEERLMLVEDEDNSTTCKSGREESHTSPTLGLKHLLNLPAGDGSTPLFMAACSGDLQLVEYLLRGGADPHFVCLAGNFLHGAVKSKSLDVIKKGFELGCDINYRNSVGDTPLHVASSIDFPEACELLILAGADLNARSTFGDTPFLNSVIDACYRNTRVLIQHGSELSAFTDIVHKTRRHFFLLALKMLKRPYELLAVLSNPCLSSLIQQHISNPQSLQALSCLVIRNQLINVSNGKSILWRIEVLPIPNPLKHLLFMKNCSEII